MGKYLDKARKMSSKFVSPNSLLNARENIEIERERSQSLGTTKQTNLTKEGLRDGAKHSELKVSDSWEWITERAAILEFEAGLLRHHAEAHAFEMWFLTFIGGPND